MRVLKLGQSLVSNSKAPAAFKNLYSLDFDGVDDYLDLGDSDAFSFGNGTSDSPFSCSLWYKTADVTGPPLITKTSSGSSSNREWYIAFGTNDALYFVVYDKSKSAYMYARTSVLTSTQNSWTHVVVTYDGDGLDAGLKLYINGELDVFSRVTSGSYIAMENTTFPLVVGAFFVFNVFLDGNVDEISLFGTELSAAQAAQIYNEGQPTDLSGDSDLVGYWRNGDPNGTAAYPTIIDQSSNSNNGTMKNMASGDIVTDVP